MLLSVVAYAFIFGWPYAVGFIGLLLVHELGHYLAARQRGLEVGLPTFVPFVGAWIEMKEQPRDAETEAWIGLAGPVLGTIAALACYFVSRDSGSKLLLALAYAGLFINLFNLIPLSPLDGGRVTAVLSPRIWLVGAPVLVAVFLWRPSPLLVFLAVLAAPQLAKAWKYDAKAPENQVYYGVSAETRLTYAMAYIGLVVFLAVMAHDVHDMLASLRR